MKISSTSFFYSLIYLTLFCIYSVSGFAQNTSCCNILTNGNFEQGNTGFTSGLPLNCGCFANSYCVGSNFQNKCPGWHNFNGKGGSGQFLIIDGSPSSAVDVWQNTVVITNEGEYCYSFWVASQYASAFDLGFTINGTLQGGPFTVSQPTPIWTEYSGTVFLAPGTHTIAIRQLSAGAERDFGIDDISLGATLTADFNVDLSINCGALLHFINTSNGPVPLTYSWDFGDPASGPDDFSNLEHPDHLFSSCGEFEVCLTVTRGECMDTECQIVSVEDFVSPNIICPPFIILDCDNDLSPGTTGYVSVTDNCDANPDIQYSDVHFGNIPCGGEIIRTWTATDFCGNMSECDQNIIVIDDVPPVITCPPNVIVIANPPECVVEVNGIKWITNTDNCGIPTVNYTITGAGAFPSFGSNDASGATFNGGISTITYISTDQCGNKDSCMFTVTVICNTMPVNCVCSTSANPKPNLVFNGNFELGDNFFYTDLNTPGGSCLSGTYSVGNDFPVQCNLWPTGVFDHTIMNNTGNFMIIDGNPTNAPTVWSQPVNVVPGKTYEFCFWTASVYCVNQQEFTLDVVMIGNNNGSKDSDTIGQEIIVEPCPPAGQPFTPTWIQHHFTWTCPATLGPPYLLEINQVSGTFGNAFSDFGLDDICFTESTTSSDSCCTNYDVFCRAFENAIILTINNDSCKATLSIDDLPCDGYIEWINWGHGPLDVGQYSGGSMPMHTYPSSGTYYISYLAIETDPATGFICFEKVLQDTITVDCGDCIEDFETGSLGQWQSLNGQVSIITDPITGSMVLKGNDNSGPSWMYNNSSDYNGDWTQKFNNCLCFDIRYDNGNPSNPSTGTGALNIYQGSDPINYTKRATFVAAPIGNTWTRICVPVGLSNGTTYPSNQYGHWTSTSLADFDMVMQGVSGISILLDFAGGNHPSEMVFVDNFCVEHCAGTACVCPASFTNMSIRWGGALNLPVTCGGSYPTPLGLPITLFGDFQCQGTNCPSANIDWELKDPSGNIILSSPPPELATPNFTIALTPSPFLLQGTYELTLIGHCGLDSCFCKIKFCPTIIPEVRDTAVCKNEITAYIPLKNCPVECGVTQVRWFVKPCTAPVWPTTPYQISSGPSCADLLLLPYQYISEPCVQVYSEVTLDGSCCGTSLLTSNIATITLCDPVSCIINNPNPSFCQSGTPTALQVSFPSVPPCSYTVQWFAQGVAINGATNLSYQPPLLNFPSNLPSSVCHYDYEFSVILTGPCKPITCATTIRVYNGNSDDGQIDMIPFESQPFCPGEDATLVYSPACAELPTGPPPTWTWWSSTVSATGPYVQVPGSGLMDPVINTNKIFNTTWYKVIKQNGVCPAEEIVYQILVKDALVITNFTAVADLCAETHVILTVDFTPTPISGTNTDTGIPCLYIIDWYLNGNLIHSSTSSSSSVSWTYLNPTPGLGSVAGVYYAVVRDNCCPQFAQSWPLIIDQTCVPVILGPCFRCYNDTSPITLTGVMVLPPKDPCPHFCTYQWYYGTLTNPIPGAINATYISPIAGIFIFESNCNGCIKRAVHEVVQCGPCPVSVNDVGKGVKVKIYPNPTTRDMTVEISPSPLLNGMVNVVDINGRVLVTDKIPGGQEKHTITLAQLTPGLYFVQVFENDILVWVDKIVRIQ